MADQLDRPESEEEVFLVVRLVPVIDQLRRLVLLVAVTSVCLVSTVSLASSAAASGLHRGGSCNVLRGVCTIGVGGSGAQGLSDGSESGGHSGHAKGGSGGDTLTSCRNSPNRGVYCEGPGVDPCSLLDPEGLSYATWEALLRSSGCAGDRGTPGSSAVAAQRAFASIHFPKPTGSRSPSQDERYRGYPFTYVGLWTWWWTDKASWRTLTATATDGNQSATVTAKPVSLTFDPGDGSTAVVCGGPGRPWTSADGNAAPTDGGCGYRYRVVTAAPITSRQSIVWKVTWTGTGGSAGEIPGLKTSTSGQLNVMQIQTVVTR